MEAILESEKATKDSATARFEEALQAMRTKHTNELTGLHAALEALQGDYRAVDVRSGLSRCVSSPFASLFLLLFVVVAHN